MKWISFDEAVPDPNTTVFITRNPKNLIVKGKVKNNETICLEKAFANNPFLARKAYVVPIFYLRMLSYRWSVGNVD